MSAAAATDAVDAGAPKKGKKKLIIIVALALLLAGGGGAAAFIMKKKAADAAAAEADEEGGSKKPAALHTPAKDNHGAPPTFVALDPFVVNLADKDVDKIAQIGITLEVEDAKFAEQMKLYMPAIRNGILMVMAHKTSQQLLERSGKEALAEAIMRESVRPMGIEVDDEDEDAPAKDAADGEDKPKKKKKKKRAATYNPVSHVLFSSFIIQ